jgi:hypothetical protein
MQKICALVVIINENKKIYTIFYIKRKNLQKKLGQ